MQDQGGGRWRGGGNRFRNLRTFRGGETAGPHPRARHPREEHPTPLMVAAGAAREGIDAPVFSERIGGKRISGFAFACSDAIFAATDAD